MSKWQDKTDFEIDVAVANFRKVYWHASPNRSGTNGWMYCDYYNKCNTSNGEVAIELPNYCSNPSDAWGIIVDNEIEVRSAKGVGYARSNTAIAIYDADIIKASSQGGALRAAMIVYLEMSGVKP